MPRTSRAAVVAAGLLLVATSSGPAHAERGAASASAGPGPGIGLLERLGLVSATAAYRNVEAAVAAGYVPTDHCVANMGHHYFNPALVDDPAIDPNRPEALLYEHRDDGSVQLVGIEYFKIDSDGDLATADDRPSLFGHSFDGPMPGHPLPPDQAPMPVHYDLHVWLYRANPAGELTTQNPTVHCAGTHPTPH